MKAACQTKNHIFQKKKDCFAAALFVSLCYSAEFLLRRIRSTTPNTKIREPITVKSVVPAPPVSGNSKIGVFGILIV